MLKKLIKNKRAQNVAEYALLISLVVAGIIAMQKYAQRALQGRVRAASMFMAGQGNDTLGNAVQYEPYYLNTDYQTSRNLTEERLLTNSVLDADSFNISDISNRTGSDSTTFNMEILNATNL